MNLVKIYMWRYFIGSFLIVHTLFHLWTLDTMYHVAKKSFHNQLYVLYDCSIRVLHLCAACIMCITIFEYVLCDLILYLADCIIRLDQCAQCALSVVTKLFKTGVTCPVQILDSVLYCQVNSL